MAEIKYLGVDFPIRSLQVKLSKIDDILESIEVVREVADVGGKAVYMQERSTLRKCEHYLKVKAVGASTAAPVFRSLNACS